MSRLGFSLVCTAFVLAACNGQQTPAGGAASTPAAALAAPAASPGPPTYANIIANPAAYTGQTATFHLGLAAGVAQANDLKSSGPMISQGWADPSGKMNELAPTKEWVDKPPEDSCIFVVVKEDKTPVLPLQPIFIDKLTPCAIGDDAHDMHGKVAEIRDVQLVLNNETVTVKAVVLKDIDFDNHPL